MLSFSKVCHPLSFPLWIYTPSRSHSFGAERDTPSLDRSPEFLSIRCINPSLPPLSQHLSLPRSLSFLSFCVNSLSMTLVYRWRGAITGCHLSPDALERACVCVGHVCQGSSHFARLVVGDMWACVCVAVRMRALRRWQSCAGRVKMMAVVRTSLQKVVVFLHRLQRMAISSPRYQKLCKVSVLCTRSLKRFHPICASLR